MGRFPNLRERADFWAFIFIAFLILLPSEGLSNEVEIAIGFPPYLSRTETFRRFQPFLGQLESKTRITIRSVFYKDTKSLLKDLEKGRIEMAYLDGITYAMNPTSSKPIAVFIYKGDERILLITRKDSSILSVEDLRNRILARIDDDVGTSWLRSLIHEKPESFFKEIRIYHGFDSVILGVLFKELNAGITSKSSFEDLKKRYPTLKENIRVIAISPPHPGYLLVAYRGMDERVASLLKDRLLDMTRTIDGSFILSSLGIQGFNSSLNTGKLTHWMDLKP